MDQMRPIATAGAIYAKASQRRSVDAQILLAYPHVAVRANQQKTNLQSPQ